MTATIRVEGLGELQRALRFAEGDLRKELRRELTKLGGIVRDDERAYLEEIKASRKSRMGIRTRVFSTSVLIEERYSTVTGLRGDWGARIMSSLATARSKRRTEVMQGLEDMLDTIGRRAGF